MPRFFSRSLRVLLDLSVISVAYWVAWLVRFEFRIPEGASSVALLTWPVALTLHYVALAVFGIPSMAWRYINLRDALQVLVAVSSSASVFIVLRLLRLLPSAPEVVVPLGVLVMDYVLVVVGIIGVRSSWRVHNEVQDRKRRKANSDRDDVLLIGAGEAGVVVAREIVNRPDLGLKPVGFLDDNRMKLNTRIFGIPVLGTTDDAAEIASRYRIKRALITIANVSGPEVRRITEICRDAGLQTKIIPSMHEIVGGKLNLSRVREVAIEDLLGRDPVTLEDGIVSAKLAGRVVLVTGAGGSIGSELCRQICRFGPERLVLVERFENALFEIHRELAQAFPYVKLDPRVADIQDDARMARVFQAHPPHIVFHAAAHKHVPMMEWNPGEAVKNNVGGTKVVATLADRAGVERFVLVSTDKAVNPTSVMGATKRLAEILVQSLSEHSSSRFVTVRFGNVLGSAGSVIPIFRKQIADGGPVLVTHPEMRRYFMTIPEASQLVLQAGAMGDGGEIFILDMGEPVRIVDLARDLITLSGLRPDDDIEIRFSGIRPGEKLFEELASDAERADKTRHPKILIGRIKPSEWQRVSRGIEALLENADRFDTAQIKAAISELVPEYNARPHAAAPEQALATRGEPAPDVVNN